MPSASTARPSSASTRTVSSLLLRARPESVRLANSRVIGTVLGRGVAGGSWSVILPWRPGTGRGWRGRRGRDGQADLPGPGQRPVVALGRVLGQGPRQDIGQPGRQVGPEGG